MSLKKLAMGPGDLMVSVSVIGESKTGNLHFVEANDVAERDSNGIQSPGKTVISLIKKVMDQLIDEHGPLKSFSHSHSYVLIPHT